MPFDFKITSTKTRSLDIGAAKRLWVVPSIYSDVWSLINAHDAILPYIAPGDRLIYMGNYIGHRDTTIETIDELLAFRRMVLAKPGMIPSDIVYLKGAQENMLTNLFQLQFSPNPLQIINNAMDQGFEPILQAMGSSIAEAIRTTREGTIQMTRYTNAITSRFFKRAGYRPLYNSHVQAAHLLPQDSLPVLFSNKDADFGMQFSSIFTARDFDTQALIPKPYCYECNSQTAYAL